jgi:hypothetical protein
MTPSENHNRLAPELLKRLITEGGPESQVMVALESVILGVMLYYRPQIKEAVEFLDTLTARVVERMAEDARR